MEKRRVFCFALAVTGFVTDLYRIHVLPHTVNTGIIARAHAACECEVAVGHLDTLNART